MDTLSFDLVLTASMKIFVLSVMDKKYVNCKEVLGPEWAFTNLLISEDFSVFTVMNNDRKVLEEEVVVLVLDATTDTLINAIARYN